MRIRLNRSNIAKNLFGVNAVKLVIISYHDLTDSKNTAAHAILESALLGAGIVGISGVPDFEKLSRAYVDAVLRFSALPDESR